jgi:hypothetical protein
MDDQRTNREGGGVRLRKLRIAWTIACVLLCQPLLLLWAVSYSESSALTMPIGSSRGAIVMVITGRLAIGVPHHALPWRTMQDEVRADYKQPDWTFRTNELIVPMWLPLVLIGTLAVAPWIRWPTRFIPKTQRNKLIPTT